MEHIFGKNILEVLTTGMYKTDATIYREYIQNSADSIRKAKLSNLYTDNDNDPSIDIEILKSERIIKITDNGFGIKQSDIKDRLLRVADSDKDEDEDMGYRGIGRLCGLAYCKTLKFITTYPGENVETVMEWDAEKMRVILDTPSAKTTAEKLLNEIVSYSTNPCEPDKHYFIVEMFGIISGHDDLLNKEKVVEYISETAPVDFNSSFHFRNKISKFVEKNGLMLPSYNITVEGARVTKKYTVGLYEGNSIPLNQCDEIKDVGFKIFKSSSGDVYGWLWFGICAFEKKLSALGNPMRGIRLRRHNIEVGDENTLSHFFQEERGNLYYIGELHVTHKQLRPNNQRDYLRDITTGVSEDKGTVRVEFEESVKLFFREELSTLYRKANSYKNAVKVESQLKEAEAELQRKKETGFINKKEEDNLNQKVEDLINKKKSSDRDIEKLSKEAERNAVFSKVIDTINGKHRPNVTIDKIHDDTKIPVKTVKRSDKKDKKSVLITDSLKQLNKKERELMGRVYSVIKEIMPEDKAIILINKIQDELNKE